MAENWPKISKMGEKLKKTTEDLKNPRKSHRNDQKFQKNLLGVTECLSIFEECGPSLYRCNQIVAVWRNPNPGRMSTRQKNPNAAKRIYNNTLEDYGAYFQPITLKKYEKNL